MSLLIFILCFLAPFFMILPAYRDRHTARVLARHGLQARLSEANYSFLGLVGCVNSDECVRVTARKGQCMSSINYPSQPNDAKVLQTCLCGDGGFNPTQNFTTNFEICYSCFANAGYSSDKTTRAIELMQEFCSVESPNATEFYEGSDLTVVPTSSATSNVRYKTLYTGGVPFADISTRTTTGPSSTSTIVIKSVFSEVASISSLISQQAVAKCGNAADCVQMNARIAQCYESVIYPEQLDNSRIVQNCLCNDGGLDVYEPFIEVYVK
ncbi:MAG: hypothetical protein M1837_004980 [Sclerophora amabilis]|nr:MAG: hypothetical protein M1837_004980 [Sclerophora amabilis]